VVPMKAVLVPRWDPDEAVELIARERITFMIGPPTFFVSLLGASRYDPGAVASLRLVSCGGAGVTPSFVREAAERLGCRVKRTYGSTEAPTVTTSAADDEPERGAVSDGRPTGEVELSVGASGELLARGPELFVGYADPADNEGAFEGDGWFRTGDRAHLDGDGWLTVTGRLKDVIIRGGENVAVAEVEAVLEAHPAVRQAVVVGEPDERLGERVAAFVVTSGPFDLIACRAWFAERGLARFKTPERVVVVDALPTLAAGKPDRAALADRLRAH
jgi:cyclohexanecarboxylate-CoA ligase